MNFACRFFVNWITFSRLFVFIYMNHTCGVRNSPKMCNRILNGRYFVITRSHFNANLIWLFNRWTIDWTWFCERTTSFILYVPHESTCTSPQRACLPLTRLAYAMLMWFFFSLFSISISISISISNVLFSSRFFFQFQNEMLNSKHL